jgi:hypothetical protein
MSRAVLESLYLGIPCILRAVDGNREVIHPEVNGALFEHGSDLARTMLEAVRMSRQLPDIRPMLLPEAFRQRPAALKYLEMVEMP